MSNVTGTDGGYRYYQRSISDLEDDLKDEAKKARERQEAESDRLDAAHREDMLDNERKAEKTANNIRENANRTIANERRKAEDEVKQARSQMYDRLGRVNGQEPNEARQQLKAAEQQIKDIQTRESDNHARAESIYEERLADQHRKVMDDTEKAIDEAKEETRKAYEDLQTERRQSDQNTIGRTKGQYEELTTQAISERNEARRQYDQAMREATKDFENRLKKTDDAYAARTRNAGQDQATRMTRAIDDQRRLHAEETSQLRDQVKNMATADSKRGNGNGMAAQFIRDTESDFRARTQMQEERAVAEQAKLKAEIADVENYQSRRQQEVVHEKEQQFTDVLRRTNQETGQRYKDLEGSFARDKKETDTMNKRAIDQMGKRQQKQIDSINQRTNELLTEQGLRYQESQRNHDEIVRSETASLQKELKQARGYEDPTKLSPQAEEAVRRSVSTQYEKSLAESQERGEREAASVRDDYQVRIQEQKVEAEGRENKLRNASRLEIDSDRKRYGQYIQDSDFQKQQTINTKELSHARETQKLQKAGALSLEEQRRQFEDAMETMHYAADQKMNALRSDLEFQLKQAHREYAANYNEAARAAEKRLNDQKEDYELQLSTGKHESQKALREQEKRFKSLSDDQVRSYEQRMKQMEMQHKEKERSIAESYEDEIEKLRHTNAALVQKKS